MSLWQRTKRFDPAVARMADRHYSRQKKGSPQFCPPGQPIVLYIPGPQWPFEVAATWVWWRPHPDKAHRFDGYDGWHQCSLFRNESRHLSSGLIKAAIPWANEVWGIPKYGYDTYVWPEKLRGTNPGYCYQMAGWKKNGWSKDGKKQRLYLPV